MKKAEHIISQFMRETTNPTADTVLFLAMQRSDPDEARQWLGVMLERGHTDTFAKLLSHADQFPPPLKATLSEYATGHPNQLRTALRHRAPLPSMTLLEIIERSHLYHLADHVVSMLHDTTIPSLAGRAGELLCRWAGELAGQRGSLDTRPNDSSAGGLELPYRPSPRDHLVRSLATAVRSFPRHQQSLAILAAMPLASADEPVWHNSLEAERSPQTHAVRRLLEKQLSPGLARFCLTALRLPSLRRSARAAISGSNDPHFVHQLAMAYSDLQDHEITSRLARMSCPGWLTKETLDTIMTSQYYRPGHRLALARLVATVASARSAQAGLLAELARQADSNEALTILEWLESMPPSQTDSALVALLTAEAPETAMRAFEIILQQSPDNLDSLLAGQINNPHPRIQEYARSRCADTIFERLWHDYENYSPARRKEVALMVVKLSSEPLALWKQHTESSAPRRRFRAVQLVREAGLVATLLPVIVPLTRDPDSTVRSAAIAAIGEQPSLSSEGEDIILQALKDTDPRVQANAIEGLHRHYKPRHLAHISAKAHHPHQRVRANAVYVLMSKRVGSSKRLIDTMLKDPHHATKRSARWVARQLIEESAPSHSGSRPALAGHHDHSPLFN